jgi:hypothetical protein
LPNALDLALGKEPIHSWPTRLGGSLQSHGPAQLLIPQTLTPSSQAIYNLPPASTAPPSETIRAAAAPQHNAPNTPHLHSLRVKEHQNVEQVFPGLNDEVMKITPV